MADVFPAFTDRVANYFGRVKTLQSQIKGFEGGNRVEPKLSSFAKQSLFDIVIKDNERDEANTRKRLANACKAANPKPRIVPAISATDLPNLGSPALFWIDRVRGFRPYEDLADMFRTVANAQPGYDLIVPTMSFDELLMAPVGVLFLPESKAKIVNSFKLANQTFGDLGLPWGQLLPADDLSLQQAIEELLA